MKQLYSFITSICRILSLSFALIALVTQAHGNIPAKTTTGVRVLFNNILKQDYFLKLNQKGNFKGFYGYTVDSSGTFKYDTPAAEKNRHFFENTFTNSRENTFNNLVTAISPDICGFVEWDAAWSFPAGIAQVTHDETQIRAQQINPHYIQVIDVADLEPHKQSKSPHKKSVRARVTNNGITFDFVVMHVPDIHYLSGANQKIALDSIKNICKPHPDGTPILVVGDFNLRLNKPNDQQTLDALFPPNNGWINHIKTSDWTARNVADGTPETLDYAFSKGFDVKGLDLKVFLFPDHLEQLVPHNQQKAVSFNTLSYPKSCVGRWFHSDHRMLIIDITKISPLAKLPMPQQQAAASFTPPQPPQLTCEDDDYFCKVFGFKETNYATVKKELGKRASLQSTNTPNGTKKTVTMIRGSQGQMLQAGLFEELNLATLRKHTEKLYSNKTSSAVPGKVTLKHINGEARSIHQHKQAHNAVIQAASQFNYLEFPSAITTPEAGITGYINDRTQGPACAEACAAGIAYRNYLIPMPDGTTGQTAKNQCNGLAGLEKIILNKAKHPLWTVTNGYVNSTQAQLQELKALLQAQPNLVDELKQALFIGVHWNTEVTDLKTTTPVLVTQTYNSALSISYSGLHADLWKELAKLVLEASYEATLLVGAINNIEQQASKPVLLTMVGGGVFGNEHAWIAEAIKKGCNAIAAMGIDLDVYLVHFNGNPANNFSPRSNPPKDYNELPSIYKGTEQRMLQDLKQQLTQVATSCERLGEKLRQIPARGPE